MKRNLKSKKSKKSSVSTNTTSTEEPDSGSSINDNIDVFLASNESIPELYDSGTSQHLSSCCEQFINFVTIPHKPIQGADNGMFNEIG